MKLQQSQIDIIKGYFQDKPIFSAYLFGSYVRGEATIHSDIDILVDLDYSQKIGLKFVQWQLDLEDLLQKKVDLVSSNGISKYIKPFVDKEKTLIYGR
jgi:uncharacterized protein